MLFAQSLDQLDHETFAVFFAFSETLVYHRHELGGLTRASSSSLSASLSASFAFFTCPSDGDGEPAKVFDQSQTQSDRDGPQFAN